ncbi:TetR/AcrR family transcriptional regulator [Nonomuraea guangzhouensis]|uniref:TetR/AcrR family transcriptional regulator n=1 Tax=Nonomuraea guangzhouensis TaxID=1291555 RepID=A0ABW4G0D1_9ACTN|nr:TetR/AcrR family transcriptional regulator [Nonomuraea guangzhouensis]
MMAGLREKKKEQTRRRIAEVALRMFAERGYEAVTVNEIAEAAEVAKVTLFTYFPTKECLVLDVVKDDTAKIVTERRPGQTPLGALRAHYGAFAAEGIREVDVDGLLTRIRVISASPTLMAGLHQTQAGQRYELAAALAGARGVPDGAYELLDQLMAAQIGAVLMTLQEGFFQRLGAGTPIAEAGRRLANEVELAFDLLEHGFTGQ